MVVKLDRLTEVLDAFRIQHSRVTLTGAGASAGLAHGLTRSGVCGWDLVDFDRVEETNIARQGHHPDQIGLRKVDALKHDLLRINPDADVETHGIDITTLSDEEVFTTFGETDLFIFATDSFQAQARGNQIALLTNTPAIFAGVYQGGRGGEVVFWHPDLDCCFCCLCASRYAAQEKAKAAGRTLDPTSEGATVFDVQVVDAIVGHLALGLLTRGANNRFGQLIDALGPRQFVQVGLTPDFSVHGKDVIREHLGVSSDCDAFFAWNSIALRDPDEGQLPCPDCERYRGHRFVEQDGRPVRIKLGTNRPPSEGTPPFDAGNPLSI